MIIELTEEEAETLCKVLSDYEKVLECRPNHGRRRSPLLDNIPSLGRAHLGNRVGLFRWHQHPSKTFSDISIKEEMVSHHPGSYEQAP